MTTIEQAKAKSKEFRKFGSYASVEAADVIDNLVTELENVWNQYVHDMGEISYLIPKAEQIIAERDALALGEQSAHEFISSLEADYTDQVLRASNAETKLAAVHRALELALSALLKKNGQWGEGHDELNKTAIEALREALK